MSVSRILVFSGEVSRHHTCFQAANASTNPAPAAPVSLGSAGSPTPSSLLAGFAEPRVTLRAERRKTDLISDEVSLGFFSSRSAQTPASCGAAADVPLNTPQPSLGPVASPGGSSGC